MRNYANDQATAKRLIEKYAVFGHVQIVRGGGTLDPVEGTIGGAGQSIPVNGVDLQVSRNLLRSGTSGAGSDVVASDRMVIMDSAVEPLPADNISIGGRVHKIIDIMPLSPAGTTVFYKVICRG